MLMIFLMAGLTSRTSFAGNIDPGNAGAKYAYGENIGWINFQPVFGPGVTVTDSAVTGKAWGENTGWINLNPGGGGVVNDGAGRLSGFAWGENTGWINFAPIGGGVTINHSTGTFSGRAWGENTGWITFRSTGAAPFGVTTSCLFVPMTSATGTTQDWTNTNVIVSLSAASNACGADVKEVHYRLDDKPEVVTPGASASVETIKTEGLHILTFYSVDILDRAEPTKTRTIKIDKTPPLITLSAPIDGATYFIDQEVSASFSAADPLSGLASAEGTNPDGAPINTSTPGEHLFSVTAEDNAGNVVTTTHRYTVVIPGNIDPLSQGSQYAYGENIGWINFQPVFGPGVTVTDSAVIGKAWGENTGWINLNPAGGGVVNNGAGRLSGFAWGENTGWINFAPIGGGVTINHSAGTFSGRAWGENIGWISFHSTGPHPFGVTTSWRPSDIDLDGVATVTEDGGPNNGDGNHDGIPDSQQNNVVSLPNATTPTPDSTDYVTLIAPTGTRLLNVRAMGNPSPADMPPGATFPIGFFDFALEGLRPGGSATVTLLLPPDVAVNSYYKYGPTPDNPLPHWYEFLFDGQTGAEMERERVILHFVDGRRGDDDLIENGMIVEPGGPAFQTPQLRLFSGFNLIATPIDSATLPDAFTLLPILGDASEIDRVLFLDAAGHIQEARFNAIGNLSGINFPLGDGVGLVVYSKVTKTVRLPGINTCTVPSLTAGLNLIGLPCPVVGLRAFEFLTALGDETVVSSIQRFNRETGGFETAVYRNGLPAGVDFPIVAGEGYFVTLKQTIPGSEP